MGLYNDRYNPYVNLIKIKNVAEEYANYMNVDVSEVEIIGEIKELNFVRGFDNYINMIKLRVKRRRFSCKRNKYKYIEE